MQAVSRISRFMAEVLCECIPILSAAKSGYTNGGFPAVGGNDRLPASGRHYRYLASALASMSCTEAVVIGW